jgi:phospholipid/cholesterol/gamma-HCH transport system permease protein
VTAPQLSREEDGQLRLSGDLVLRHAKELTVALTGVDTATTINLATVERVDGSGIVVLLDFLDRMATAGHEVAITGNNARANEFLELYRSRRGPGPAPRPKKPNPVAIFGAFACSLAMRIPQLATACGTYTAMVVGAIRQPRTVCWRDVPLLMQRAGAEGTGVVVMTNLLIGAVMGFMGVVQLSQFGASAFTPTMVALGHLRELGPIMTAIIVAGRSGAGFAAELGTMKVSEEVDALRTMGFDPLRWLMLPRVLALLIALPLLTLIGDVVGLAGGALAALPMMEMSVGAYIDATAKAAHFQHFGIGMFKSILFAISIGVIACSQGLAARGGAAAVGVRTTEAVVLSIFSVVLIDAAIAILATAVGV